MNKTTATIFQGYRKMSGEEKIRLGMKLSAAVREMRRAGAIATKTTNQFGQLWTLAK